MGLTILNIQKFCRHDGPGIRTTVFLKGCPLSCHWCHNPESIKAGPELVVEPDKCVSCGRCRAFCTYETCENCGECVAVCPNQARTLIGRVMAIDDIMAEVLKDKVFYETSGGGVTLSGGEPLLQSEKLLELVMRLKEADLHVALDTSGFCDWQKMKSIADHIDLFLFDLKLGDADKHLQYTGVDNRMIVENLQHLSRENKRIWLRLPLIADVNSGPEDIGALLDVITHLAIEQINLLPYHAYGTDKWRKYNGLSPVEVFQPPSGERMDEIKNRFESHGFKVVIGG